LDNTRINLNHLFVQQRRNSLSSPDLLEVMQKAITAMQSVVAEKLQLFGSVGKGHLHQSF